MEVGEAGSEEKEDERREEPSPTTSATADQTKNSVGDES